MQACEFTGDRQSDTRARGAFVGLVAQTVEGAKDGLVGARGDAGAIVLYHDGGGVCRLCHRDADRAGARGMLFGVAEQVADNLGDGIGLAMGLRREQLAIWLSIGTIVLFAIYTLGLWAIIELVN